MAGGEIVIVQDYSQTLRTIDRIVAQVDVEPAQLVIEGVIVQLKIAKGKEATPLFGSAGERERKTSPSWKTPQKSTPPPA